MQKMVKFVVGLWLALMVQPAAADGWNVAETAHFRVYSNGSAATLAKRAAVLEDYRALLSALTTRKDLSADEPRLDVFLVPTIGASRPFGRVSKSVAGYYASDTGRIAAYSVADDREAEQYLLHEYAHHFMLGTPGTVAYPGWYVEGFAEYFMTARFEPTRIEFGDINRGRASWLVYAPWLPLEKLLSGKFDRNSGDQVAGFYAESWLLTHYLFRTPGMPAKLDAYLRAVATGSEPLEAFKQHIDPSPAAFQRKLENYLERSKLTYSKFDRSAKTPATVVVKPLSPAAEPMLLQLTSLEFGIADDQRDKALKQVRGSATRFPGDPLAERTLAFAEMRYGDRTAGIARLDALLAISPQDPTLLRWRGEAALPRGGGRFSADDAKTARKYFARAFKANPNDWQTLYLYAMMESPYAGKMSAAALDVLLRAHELAPQVEEIGLAAALALARADRMPEAVRKLEPIAFSPHSGGVGETAAALLPLARAGDAQAFIVGFDAVRDEQRAAAAKAAGQQD